jgi:hypothetical protein
MWIRKRRRDPDVSHASLEYDNGRGFWVEAAIEEASSVYALA